MAISKVKLPDNTVQPIKDNVTPRMYLGTCPTAAATVTKVVTVEDFPLDSEGEPLIGTLIGVKFTNTNSATAPKLNVNEIGAKSIYYNSAAVTSTSSVYGGSAARYAYYVWDGTYWVWVTHGTDNNDNTLAYNVRYNSASKTTIDKFARYRILFTSADDAHWVPANTSTSTNATASRTVNQTPINPFGQIVYYGSTTSISAGGTPSATVLYTQYALTFGYSFNRTGAALTLTTKTPVYIKCAPQSNGSAIIDADTPYVQALPSTEDGKIYIYLGIASSATAVEMSIVHPVYYYKDGLVRPWINAASQSNSLKYIDEEDLADGIELARNGDVIGQFTVVNKNIHSQNTPTTVATISGTDQDEINILTYHKTNGSWIQDSSHAYKLSDNVKFSSQSLTDVQKTQARSNIDAVSKAVSISYSELVALRTAETLVSGQYYRITDYVTTTADTESRSVGHLFDVIVLALDESHLSEEAFAAHHDGDIYFANSALDAWRIWYCLDNDTTRFAWADTTNGKGVIYRMIDEYDNDVPYDFKNIQFKRYEIASTTQSFLSPLVGLFIGWSGYTGITIDSSSYKWYYTFSKLGNTWDAEVEDGSFGRYAVGMVFENNYLFNAVTNITKLSNNVLMNGPVVFDFLKTQMGGSGTYTGATGFATSHIRGEDSINNTSLGDFSDVDCQPIFKNNLIVSHFWAGRVGRGFGQNTCFALNFKYFGFGAACYSNIIKVKNINQVMLEDAFGSNTIELTGDLASTTIGQGFLNNIVNATKITNSAFGNAVSRNTFTGEFASIRINGQFTYCTFTGKFIACSFEPICGYVDFVGGTNGAACVGLDVVGSIRGTTSSHITISSSNFILPDASGTNRRIRLEGATDGSIIATWKGTDGVPTGIRSTDNGTTWVAYSPAPIDVVKYTQQTLTDAQKLQARTNIGVEDSVLVSSLTDYPEPYDLLNPKTLAQTATAFGVSESEIIALSEGKYSQIKFGDNVLGIDSIKVTEGLDPGEPWTIVYFGTTVGQSTLTSTKALAFIWDNAERTSAMTLMQSVEYENITYKCTSWQNNPDDTHYPSEKLVKDSLDAKYTKPSAGIPASDLAAGVIPTVPTDIVKYTAQSLTDAQKTQARNNIGAGTYSKPSSGIPASDLANGVIPEQEIFWVEYGVTSTSDIFSAITNNKAIKIKRTDLDTGLTEIYDFVGTGFGGSYNFICSQGYSARMISVTEGSETWTVPYDITIQEYNKVTSLSSFSTDAQYPSAKCVYDEVHPAVASTKPQGGFLPNVEYNLGTLTGSVTFALASAVSGIGNKWYWCFKAGATAPTITWPSGLLWPQPNAEPPTIEAGDEVEVEVKNGHIVALVFKPTS